MDKEKEIWKDIKEFEGKYQVSNYGRVRSCDTLIESHNGKISYLKRNKGKIIKAFQAGGGKKLYSYVKLYKDNVRFPKSIHRLVAEAFVQNPENKPEVDHIIPLIDGGTNEASNLRWVTKKENRNNELTLKRIINNEWSSIPILQYTQDGILVQEYPSIHEAERNGFRRKEIVKCCKGIFKTHYGFVWRYKNDA